MKKYLVFLLLLLIGCRSDFNVCRDSSEHYTILKDKECVFMENGKPVPGWLLGFESFGDNKVFVYEPLPEILRSRISLSSSEINTDAIISK